MWPKEWMLKASFWAWLVLIVLTLTLMIVLYSRVVYTLWFKRDDDNQLSHQQRVSVNEEGLYVYNPFSPSHQLWLKNCDCEIVITTFVIMTLWLWLIDDCYWGIFFLTLELWHWLWHCVLHCDCDIVFVTLWLWHCDHGTVITTLFLLHCDCDIVFVTLLLWHYSLV